MINPIGSNTSESATDNTFANGIDTGSLLGKINSGVEIEALLEKDTFFQRKVSMTLRKCNLDERRRLMEAAVLKMKEAADDRISSAWLGSSLKIAAAVVSACCAGASSAARGAVESANAANIAATRSAASAATSASVSAPVGITSGFASGAVMQTTANSEIWKQLAIAGSNAAAEGLSRYNPYEYSATMNDTKAKILDQANALESERQRSNEEWLNSARELERKMIDRMEQMDRTEHEINMVATGVR